MGVEPGQESQRLGPDSAGPNAQVWGQHVCEFSGPVKETNYVSLEE